jgi:hypothetical protein
LGLFFARNKALTAPPPGPIAVALAHDHLPDCAAEPPDRQRLAALSTSTLTRDSRISTRKQQQIYPLDCSVLGDNSGKALK